MDVKQLLDGIWLRESNASFPLTQTFKDVVINGSLTEVRALALLSR